MKEELHFQPSTRLPFLLSRNMNLLPPSGPGGGGLELESVERIYHYTENVFAHRGVTVNM